MKSASSYQYQLISEILHARHRKFEDYLEYRKHLVGPAYSGLYFDPSFIQFNEILTSVPGYDFFAFKTHNYFNNSDNDDSKIIQKHIEKDRLRIIGSIRDPREIILSAMDHSKRTLEDGTNDFFGNLDNAESIIPHIQHAFVQAKKWHQTKKVIWIPYDCLFNYETEIIMAIQDLVGLNFIDIFDRIEKLKEKGQLHQFNKGVQNRWQNELSPQQKADFSLIFKNEIDFYQNIQRSMIQHFKRYSKYTKTRIESSKIKRKYFNFELNG